jgi:ferritin-like metal-binding protein YciE
MKTRDELIDWLRDAYAMERGLEITLEKQSKKEDLPPEVSAGAARHLGETRRHAEEIKRCLEGLGTDTSTLKTGMAQGMEVVKGAASMMARDEIVKDVLAGYAAEHFEIACYTALKAGAQELGETSVVALCESILPDEVRMAENILNSIPAVVATYLSQTAAGAA